MTSGSDSQSYLTDFIFNDEDNSAGNLISKSFYFNCWLQVLFVKRCLFHNKELLNIMELFNRPYYIHKACYFCFWIIKRHAMAVTVNSTSTSCKQTSLGLKVIFNKLYNDQMMIQINSSNIPTLCCGNKTAFCQSAISLK